MSLAKLFLSSAVCQVSLQSKPWVLATDNEYSIMKYFNTARLYEVGPEHTISDPDESINGTDCPSGRQL